MATRDYAPLPHEYLEEMEMLDDAEFGRLVRALLRYSSTGESVELDGDARFYAKRVMNREDRYQESFTAADAKRSASGAAGAAARWGRVQSDADACDGMPTHANACERIDEDAGACEAMRSNAIDGNTKAKAKTETKANILPTTVGENNARARAMTPPTVDEVKAYCDERHSTVDAEHFVSYYSSQGWKVGRNPMKDWKAAVRTWEQKDRERNAPRRIGQPGSQPTEERLTPLRAEIQANRDFLKQLREA